MRSLMLPALALALAPAAVAGGQTWTVDIDGGADFTTIDEAIDSAAVADGDTLLVEDGNYPEFTLDRPLMIVGRSGEGFYSSGVRIENLEEFTIAGLTAKTLDILNVSGRGQLDDCVFGHWVVNPHVPALVWQGRSNISDCSELVISRTNFHGSETYYPDFLESYPGLEVSGSSLALTDCEIVGGDNWDHPINGAMPGLWIRSQSFASISGCTLVGGRGGPLAGASGLFVEDSEVHVRGTGSESVVGGLGADDRAPGVGGTTAFPATISGVRHDASSLPGWITAVFPPEPHLRLADDGQPAGNAQLEVYGPAGARCIVFWSLVPDYRPGFMPNPEPLWLERGSILGATITSCSGHETPTLLSIPQPARMLPGDVAIVQGFLPSLEGQGRFLTNPAQIVARP